MFAPHLHKIAPTIQPQLTIGEPDDKYEREADAVADQVMRMADPVSEVQRKCEVCEHEQMQRKELSTGSPLIQKEPGTRKMIQRQEVEQPDATVTTTVSPDAENTPAGSEPSSFRAGICMRNPEFPDFPCLLRALKLDVDDNLRTNAHHFFRIATLFPDRPDMMWNTFMRYGIGVNLLQTTYGFLGAEGMLNNVLSYGTGIGFKAYDFAKNGVLTLDLPIPLTDSLNLELNFDLAADPTDRYRVRGLQTGVGLSGSF